MNWVVSGGARGHEGHLGARVIKKVGIEHEARNGGTRWSPRRKRTCAEIADRAARIDGCGATARPVRKELDASPWFLIVVAGLFETAF